MEKIIEKLSKKVLKEQNLNFDYVISITEPDEYNLVFVYLECSKNDNFYEVIIVINSYFKQIKNYFIKEVKCG